jgi:hypothetical protein
MATFGFLYLKSKGSQLQTCSASKEHLPREWPRALLPDGLFHPMEKLEQPAAKVNFSNLGTLGLGQNYWGFVWTRNLVTIFS